MLASSAAYDSKARHDRFLYIEEPSHSALHNHTAAPDIQGEKSCTRRENDAIAEASSSLARRSPGQWVP
jgi:hypothetical protein